MVSRENGKVKNIMSGDALKNRVKKLETEIKAYRDDISRLKKDLKTS